MEVSLELESRRATRHLAAALAAALEVGDVVWLEGALGAGKTFFARGLLRALGVPSEIPVTSPTFALVHEHVGRAPIAHLDLYRLGDPDEVDELGLDELMERAITVVEWGAAHRARLGDRGVEVRLDRAGRARGRAAALSARDARGEAILRGALADPRVARRLL